MKVSSNIARTNYQVRTALPEGVHIRQTAYFLGRRFSRFFGVEFIRKVARVIIRCLVGALSFITLLGKDNIALSFCDF